MFLCTTINTSVVAQQENDGLDIEIPAIPSLDDDTPIAPAAPTAVSAQPVQAIPQQVPQPPAPLATQGMQAAMGMSQPTQGGETTALPESQIGLQGNWVKKRKWLEQALSLAEAEAKQFNDQILESLISQRLLLQAASKKGVNVSDADIKSQLALISEQFGGEEAMQAAVLEQGYTTAELNDQIKNDLVIKAYLKQLFAGAELTASEDEIATLYEQFSAGSEDSPELEEVRSDIESFVLQQKEQERTTAHIAELRAAAEIEISI